MTFRVYFKSLVITAALALFGGGLFLYSGLYPMGADVEHNRFTYWLLETLRERSVARSADAIEVPPGLDSSEHLLSGGADYNDMCAGCHLKPGKTDSDFTLGLYPVPPNLTLAHDEHADADSGQIARRQFWIIKHGIKASGMPAWGPTHDDQRIWAMVAFLQRLPDLDPEQYQIITARGETNGSSHH